MPQEPPITTYNWTTNGDLAHMLNHLDYNL
jgi:hypothetical protein